MTSTTFRFGLPRRTFAAAMGAAATCAAALLMAAPALAQDKPGSGRGVIGEDVAIPTPDGTADAALFYPSSGKGPWPAVILWHDLPGLRAVWRDMAARLAGEGFVVLAPNAFYRSAKADGVLIDMRDAKMRERQTAYRNAATDEGIARDAVAYLAWLDTRKQVAAKTKAGTIGYDVGGSYAFRTAAAAPDRIAAVASIHGLGAATARPNSPHLLVPKTRAAYFIVQSKDDDAREPEDKTDYQKVIADGKLEGKVEVYPANHGFGIPGNAAFDAASADKAWGEIVGLMKAKLK
jgi:carboxymethylenebutenolidase